MITGDFTPGAGVTKVCVEQIGRGADGDVNFFNTGGGSGGGGGYCRADEYAVTPGTPYPYAVGDAINEATSFPVGAGDKLECGYPNTWHGGPAGRSGGTPATAAYSGGDGWFSSNDRAYGRGAGGGASADGAGHPNPTTEQGGGDNATPGTGKGGDGGNFDANGNDGTGPGAGGGGAGGESGGGTGNKQKGLGHRGGVRFFDNSDSVGYPACATAGRLLLTVGDMPPLPAPPSTAHKNFSAVI